MINGIPVNDMENGWVYWSNWDGLGDVTSSIQIQRGLSATTLATQSIGGKVNIVEEHQLKESLINMISDQEKKDYLIRNTNKIISESKQDYLRTFSAVIE